MPEAMIAKAQLLVAESIAFLNGMERRDARQVECSKRLISESYELLARLNNPTWKPIIFVETRSTSLLPSEPAEIHHL